MYNDTMQFKELLKIFRERATLTKTALAEKVGVTPTYMMELESGRKPPSTLARCREIAKALSLSPGETKSLIDAAMKERISDEVSQWINEKNCKFFKIPVISWVSAGSWNEAVDPYPPGVADEYTTTMRKGERMFALKIHKDCMEPHFHTGEYINIDPELEPHNGDFLIIKNITKNEVTFKQYFKKADHVVLHPLNPKYKDIILKKGEFTIIGVAVEKLEKLR